MLSSKDNEVLDNGQDQQTVQDFMRQGGLSLYVAGQAGEASLQILFDYAEQLVSAYKHAWRN